VGLVRDETETALPESKQGLPEPMASVLLIRHVRPQQLDQRLSRNALAALENEIQAKRKDEMCCGRERFGVRLDERSPDRLEPNRHCATSVRAAIVRCGEASVERQRHPWRN
jgi:hypothetical protein